MLYRIMNDVHTRIVSSDKINSVTRASCWDFYIKIIKYENYSIYGLVNGLFDHDAQIITINNVTVDKGSNKTQSIRKF
jgi:hypothetical protein